MGVKGMIGKMLYIDYVAAEAIKEIAECDECSKECWARGHNQFRGTIMCNEFKKKKGGTICQSKTR